MLPTASSDIHERARTLLPRMLDDLERLVCLESPTADLDAVAASADMVTELGETHLGTMPERIVVDGRTHLRWRFGTGLRRVLVLAHHDTVWPVGSLATHPWSNVDGVVRGPGCFDMLAGLVQAFYALDLLHASGTDLDGVTLLVTGDEEIGSPTSRALIESEATGCSAAFVLEAAGPGGALKTERKGTSLYTVEVSGRAAHAGLEPENGVNAGIELAHQILAIATLGDSAHGTTVTPTVFGGGTTTNTVPATSSVSVDVRACTAAEQQRVDDDIRRLETHLPGSVVTVTGRPNRPPLNAGSSAGLFERAQLVAEAHDLGELTSMAVGGGSDGNFTAGIGVPTLDGLGAVGGGAHADDEHVLTAAIPDRTALLAFLIADQVTGRHGER